MTDTHHATVRAQQRAISPFVVDLLLQFGRREPVGGGAEKIFFDKRARKNLRTYAGTLAPALEPHLDVYAVVTGSETVITIAHREERIRRG